jgi:hypothetical protein
MQIVYQKEFTDFGYAAGELFGAGIAINTRALPEGDTFPEFAADFLKKSLSRRFTENFGRIHSALYLSECEFTYNYESTSGTEIVFTGKFDNNMNPYSTLLTILLPDSRFEPGRRSYEALTKEFYLNQFSVRGEDRKFAILTVTVNDEPLPTPEWALEEVIDRNLTDDEIKKELIALDFCELTQLHPLWQARFWLHRGLGLTVIWQRERDLPRFSLSTEKDGSIDFQWRLEALKNQIEHVKSRPAIESTLDEYEDYPDEDFDIIPNDTEAPE